MGLYLLPLLFFFVLRSDSACGCNHKGSLKDDQSISAITILHPENNSKVKGYVSMHQKHPLSPVYFEFIVVGLNNNSLHGVHIHKYGDLTQGCKTAGPHYNPYNKKHGGPKDVQRHAGDLGNLLTNRLGKSQQCLIDSVVTLFGQKSIIGRSIVVHKNKDDLGKGGDSQSLITGNAGARLACGVIGLAEKFRHFDVKDIQ